MTARARPAACATRCSPARRACAPPRGGLLEAVAVARPRAEIWLLERIAAEELPELEACLASGMLRAEGDAVAFRHEIARATIEDELPPHRRVALHRAALAALVGRGEPARLAHHAEAADDGAAVLEYAAAAGERAARLGAHREAAAHFSAALERAGGLAPAARAALLERRSYECFLERHDRGGGRGDDARARDLRRRPGTGCGRATRSAGSRGSRGTRATARASRSAAVTAVEILETLPPGRELALRVRRARAALHDGLRPRGDARVGREGDRSGGAARRDGGARRGAPQRGDDRVVPRAGGGPREAAAQPGRSRSSAGWRTTRRSPTATSCRRAHDMRDYDTALAHLEAGRAFCDEHDLLAWDTYLGGWEARIALDHGRWADAAALAGENLERTRGALPHSRFGSLLVLGVAARPPRRRGPVAGARRGAGHRHTRRTSWSGSLPWPPRGRRRAGSRARPMAIAGGDRRRAGAGRGQRPSLDDRRARGLAPPRGPVRRRRRAAAAAIPGGARRRPACRRGVLDRPRMPLRRRARARPAVTWRTTCARACARCRAWGPGPPRRSSRGASASGAPAACSSGRAPRRGRTPPASPRASSTCSPCWPDGDRNADIAAKLFLSEKTVDHHVSAILRKLGVRTRGQAAAEAARLGIAGR